MFAAHDESDNLVYYLLVDASGAPANEVVIPYVGEPTIVTGETEERSGQLQPKVTAASRSGRTCTGPPSSRSPSCSGVFVLLQKSIERSCRFSVVMSEDSAESFASGDRT